MTPYERLAKIKDIWRELRAWVSDTASTKEGSEDEWALRLAMQLDQLLGEESSSNET